MQEARSTKQEVVELLCTLLSLFRQHSHAEADPELLHSWRGALRMLLAGYGASLGAADRATLRALRALDAALQAAEGGPALAKSGTVMTDDGAAAADVSELLTGPLAQSG